MGGVHHTLTARWNGSKWKWAWSPNPGGSSNDAVLLAADATTASNVWAVGYYFGGPPDKALALHCC